MVRPEQHLVFSALLLAFAFTSVCQGRYVHTWPADADKNMATKKATAGSITPPMIAGKQSDDEEHAWQKAAALKGALQALEAFDALYAFQSRPRYSTQSSLRVTYRS